MNAASYAAAVPDSSNIPIGNNIIAQGSIFVVFGRGMGPAALLQPSGLPLPTSLPGANGTSVSVASGGQAVSAFLLYSSATQVAAILPSNTPVGAANVTVSYNGQTSAVYKISVVKSAFGVFTQNTQGNGPAIAQVFHGGQPPALAGLANSAQAGDTLVLYGTGLGAIGGPDNSAPGAVPAGSNVTINIAGITIPATYAGRSPEFPGLDQINFQLPANTAAGCYVPAEITASGMPSNRFYVSIGDNSAVCVHPLGLGASALARLDAGGTANIGHFLMLRAVSILAIEGTGGVFDSVGADGAFQLTNRILYAFGGVNYPVASGTCAVLDTLDPGAAFGVPAFSAIGGKELAGGASINVAGTNGKSASIPHDDAGGYLGVFFATLGAGTWTVSGAGGRDVGVFSAKTDLPANLAWTNVDSFSSVPRSNATINWSGGNLNGKSLVTIFGLSVVLNPADPAKSRGKQFYCNAPAAANTFVVPQSVLSQLPASTADAGAGEIAFGTLGIQTGGGSGFTAPVVGGQLDAGYLAYGEAHTIQVKYQ